MRVIIIRTSLIFLCHHELSEFLFFCVVPRYVTKEKWKNEINNIKDGKNIYFTQ